MSGLRPVLWSNLLLGMKLFLREFQVPNGSYHFLCHFIASSKSLFVGTTTSDFVHNDPGREAYLEVVDPNDGDRTVAFITKGWAGGMQELFTSANSFYAAQHRKNQRVRRGEFKSGKEMLF